MNNKNNEQNGAPILQNLTNQDFLNFGIQHLAYVKPIQINGKTSFAIHAADGTPLSVMESMQEAIATIRQNALDAVVIQ